jgi:hypothetical protein
MKESSEKSSKLKIIQVIIYFTLTVMQNAGELEMVA